MNRFCVKCGREMNALIMSLCPDCYLEKNKVIDIPEKMKVDLDKTTLKVRLGRHWLEPTDEAFTAFLLEKVSTKMKEKLLPLRNFIVKYTRAEREIEADLTIDTILEGVTVTLKRKVMLELNKTISDASMKLASNYHEAIIQGRFRDENFTPAQAKEKLEEVLGALAVQKKKDELSEAVDVKKVNGGFDIYVGSKKSARKVTEALAKKYKTKITFSNKLLGTKDGNEYYRDFLCIRF